MLVVKDQHKLKEWFNARVNPGGCDNEATFFGKEINQELVAVAGYSNYNPDTSSVYLHLAGEEGKNWMTKDFLWFMFAYPFVQLDCQVLLANILSNNQKCLQLANHIGFKLLEVQKQKCGDLDVHVFWMFRPMCKYLNLKGKLK